MVFTLPIMPFTASPFGFTAVQKVPAVLHVTLQMEGLPACLSGYTVAVLSDIHGGPLVGAAEVRHKHFEALPFLVVPLSSSAFPCSSAALPGAFSAFPCVFTAFHCLTLGCHCLSGRTVRGSAQRTRRRCRGAGPSTALPATALLCLSTALPATA